MKYFGYIYRLDDAVDADIEPTDFDSSVIKGMQEIQWTSPSGGLVRAFGHYLKTDDLYENDGRFQINIHSVIFADQSNIEPQFNIERGDYVLPLVATSTLYLIFGHINAGGQGFYNLPKSVVVDYLAEIYRRAGL